MKCSNCGYDIPAGRGFCPKCGNMAGFGGASIAAPELKKEKRNTVAVGAIGRKKERMPFFLAIIVILVLALFVLAMYMMKEKSQSLEDVNQEDLQTEIFGYWESFNKIKVGDMLTNILVENDFSESDAKAVASALGLKDEKIKVNLVFYEDQTLRIGFGGSFVGDKANMTYELISDEKLIINYSGKLHLPSVNVLGVELGLGDKELKIAHTFQYEYDAEDKVLSIEVFGEKVRLKKDE